MDVQFQNNSLSVSHKNKIYQLHPVWLRERLPGDEYFDIDTHQRLYEPSSIDLDLQISSQFESLRFTKSFLNMSYRLHSL